MCYLVRFKLLTSFIDKKAFFQLGDALPIIQMLLQLLVALIPMSTWLVR